MTTQPRSRKEDLNKMNRAVSAPARGKKSPSIVASRSNDDSRPSSTMTRPSTAYKSRPASGSEKSLKINAPSPDHQFKTRLKAWREEK
jgi:hypothetical protein